MSDLRNKLDDAVIAVLYEPNGNSRADGPTTMQVLLAACARSVVAIAGESDEAKAVGLCAEFSSNLLRVVLEGYHELRLKGGG
jgi:hypothetical protein